MCVEELVTNIWSSPHLNLRDFPLSNRRLWLVKVRIEREKRMLRGISRSYPSPSWKLRSIRRFSTPVSISDDVTTGGFINTLAGNNPTLLGMNLKSLHKHIIIICNLQASPVRQHHFRIRVVLTGGHHKVFYLRTRCWRYNKTDSGFNNWIDEWLSLWIGFIYSQGSMDRYLKILLGPRPVRGSWKFLGPRTTLLLSGWSGPPLSKFRWSARTNFSDPGSLVPSKEKSENSIRRFLIFV